MKKVRLSSAEVYDQAAAWVARRDAGSMTPEDMGVLETWLAADPRHHGAFVQGMALLGPRGDAIPAESAVEPAAPSSGARRATDG